MPTFNCPTCQKPVEWSAAAKWRPFCSERCRLIDLGAWMTESHVIAGEEPQGGTGDLGLQADTSVDDDTPRH